MTIFFAHAFAVRGIRSTSAKCSFATQSGHRFALVTSFRYDISSYFAYSIIKRCMTLKDDEKKGAMLLWTAKRSFAMSFRTARLCTWISHFDMCLWQTKPLKITNRNQRLWLTCGVIDLFLIAAALWKRMTGTHVWHRKYLIVATDDLHDTKKFWRGGSQILVTSIEVANVHCLETTWSGAQLLFTHIHVNTFPWDENTQLARNWRNATYANR